MAHSSKSAPANTEALLRLGSIYVCCLQEVAQHVESLTPSHLISLVPDFEQPETPPILEPGRHLRLELDDIDAPAAGLTLPHTGHVQQLIAFAQDWSGSRPMLVHCAAGVSRSAAAALVIACARSHAENEDSLVDRLRRTAPHARPNLRILALADRLLGRNGRLVKAALAFPKDEKPPRGPLWRLDIIMRATSPLSAARSARRR